MAPICRVYIEILRESCTVLTWLQLPVFQDRFNVEFKSGVSVDIIE